MLPTDDVHGDKETKKLEKCNLSAFVGPRGKYCFERVNQMLWRKKFCTSYFSFFIRFRFQWLFESDAVENHSNVTEKTG